MSLRTIFVDRVNGNNANDGLSFAQAIKDLTGFTFLAGDEVRVAKSPDPTLVASATWTNLSKTVTLAAPVTANISTCDSAWTANTSVTATTNSVTFKEGTSSCNLAVVAAFTTGRIAHFATGLLDLSAYQQVSLAIRTSIAVASGVLQIKLCSDTGGVTAVNTLTINVGTRPSVWKHVTIDNGSALGSAIQSVAIYAVSDPGAVTINLDNILACKAPSAADSLTLNSIIGKNSAGESWFPIQSINGTTVIIGASINVSGDSTTLRGYTGTSGTANLYKRDPIFGTDNFSGVNSSWGTMTVLGTAANPVTVSGGWDTATSMATQTGETFFSMNSITDLGMKIEGSWISISKLHFTQHRFGIYVNGAKFCTFDGLNLFGASEYGIFAELTSAFNNYNNMICSNNGLVGIAVGTNERSSGVTAHGNGSYGLYVTGSRGIIRSAVAKNNGIQGLYTGTDGVTRMHDCSASDNGTGSLRISLGRTFLFNCTLSDATEVTISTSLLGATVLSHNHNNVAGAMKIIKEGGTITSDTVDREKSSGKAWKMSVTSTVRDANFPLNLGDDRLGHHETLQVACLANLPVTVSTRVKRDNTGITLKMVCPGGQIAGVPSDVVATAAASAGTYETLTLNFTPTEDGVVDIIYQAYGGTTYSAWVDRVAVLTQA